MTFRPTPDRLSHPHLTGLRLVAAIALTACTSGPLAPTGPQPIGTTTWVVEHPDTLADPLPLEDGDRRVPVQAWYPTPDGEAGDVHDDAPLADTDAPVLVFLHGGGSERAFHTSLYQELASWGYVTIAADHPGIARKARFPDQKAVKLHDDFVASMESGNTLIAAADPLYFEIVDLMRADVELALAELPPVLSELDTSTLAVGGHSLGAGVALDFCRDDARCAVYVDLDGPPLVDQTGVDADGQATLEAGSLDVPSIVVSTGLYPQHVPGADHAWAELDQLAENIDGPVVHYHMAEAGHLDVTDIPLIMPPALARSLFGDGDIGRLDAAETVGGANDSILAFLDRYLRCDPTAAPETMDEVWSLLELRHAHDDRRDAPADCP